MVPVLTAGLDLLRKRSLPQSMLGRLRDGMLAQKLLRGQIEVDVLARHTSAVEPVTQGEEILPLGVGTGRIDGRNGHAGGFESVSIAHEGDDAVALGDVLLEPLDQGAWSLLEILLDLDFAADRAEVAGERISALFELV